MVNSSVTGATAQSGPPTEVVHWLERTKLNHSIWILTKIPKSFVKWNNLKHTGLLLISSLHVMLSGVCTVPLLVLLRCFPFAEISQSNQLLTMQILESQGSRIEAWGTLNLPFSGTISTIKLQCSNKYEHCYSFLPERHDKIKRWNESHLPWLVLLLKKQSCPQYTLHLMLLVLL